MDNIIYKYNCSIIGDCCTGKTLSIKKYIYPEKELKIRKTIGVDILINYNTISKINFKEVYYDLSGENRFKPIYNCYLKDSSIVLVFFDPLKNNWKDRINYWNNFVKNLNDECIIIFVANILNSEKFDDSDILKFIKEKKMIYYLNYSFNKESNNNLFFIVSKLIFNLYLMEQINNYEYITLNNKIKRDCNGYLYYKRDCI